MKQIVNWREASVADIETDGMLDTVSKIHIIGIKLYNKEDILLLEGSNHERINKMLDYHIDNKIPIVGHNFIGYDVPVLEKILNRDLSELMVIDTLYLSWYLNIDKNQHSIEALSKDYPEAMEKFQIDEGGWENLSWEDAVNRVTPDVQIGEIIWKDFIARLEDMYSLAKVELDSGGVGGKRTHEGEEIYIDRLKGLSVDEHISRIITFLMFKADCVALQEKTGWDVDIEYLDKGIEELEGLVESAAAQLEGVMPPSPKYVSRKPPKNPYKKNGELSVAGERWEALKDTLRKAEKDEWGNLKAEVVKEGEIRELVGYNPPNINSHQQVKDFLFSKGWIPATFNYIRDKEAFDKWVASKPAKGAFRGEWTAWNNSKPEDRAVPQVRVDAGGSKELCESVSELAKIVPEIQFLEEYSVIKHRLDTMKGIKSRIDSKGQVKAGVNGLTNTLRMQHRAPVVNLVSADRPYAKYIRGSLIAGKGNISIGSDMSGLENRVGHHFMLPHDPEYVETMMAEGFDPHLDMAMIAGMVTKEEVDWYKANKEAGGEEIDRIERIRDKGKTTNYASVYNAGAATIARGAGISLREGEVLHEAYWERNWAVKAVAEEQTVVEDSKGLKWIINPVNGYLYNIRTEKDIFSTLAQGTGAFLFDMWVDKLLYKMMEKWGRKTLTAQFHK